MSVSRRRAKAERNRHAAPKSDVGAVMRAAHQQRYPNCTYGDQPHFVPPSFGDIGFFMCDPPRDIRNHTRCVAPYDHEHEDHRFAL